MSKHSTLRIEGVVKWRHKCYPKNRRRCEMTSWHVTQRIKGVVKWRSNIQRGSNKTLTTIMAFEFRCPKIRVDKVDVQNEMVRVCQLNWHRSECQCHLALCWSGSSGDRPILDLESWHNKASYRRCTSARHPRPCWRNWHRWEAPMDWRSSFPPLGMVEIPGQALGSGSWGGWARRSGRTFVEAGEMGRSRRSLDIVNFDGLETVVGRARSPVN